jgi:hypothetical protein
MILQKNGVYAVPILHYKMEFAAAVHHAFQEIKPDCIAVELPEPLTEYFLKAARRLPDITLVADDPLFYMCEPCDGAMEALRLACLSPSCDAFCIDLKVKNYPDFLEPFPDPYAVTRIGFQKYYEAYKENAKTRVKHPLDEKRELYMARRLKELSLCYDRVLFIGGFHHVESVLDDVTRSNFPKSTHEAAQDPFLCTLTAESTRECMAETGWTTLAFLENRTLLDRQQLLYNLYKESGQNVPKNRMKMLLKYARNLSLLQATLTPSLADSIVAAKGCVDDHFAYDVWRKATDYPYRQNQDELPELDLTAEELWGASKRLHFRFKEKRRKGYERSLGFAPSMQMLCSYPKEDVVIETLAQTLKQKAQQKIQMSVPFSGSLEEGLDVRETVRNWHQKKLFVTETKQRGKKIGTIVIIFDEDNEEKFPWKMTWMGEHEQESDMAFYATALTNKIVGPGISRCTYGGLLMTSPPRRLFDIWDDPDYQKCETKAEMLLMAAIDYSIETCILYLSKQPPNARLKGFAARFGKKIIYQPLNTSGSLNKIRTFHVLDGHHTRKIADDYI